MKKLIKAGKYQLYKNVSTLYQLFLEKIVMRLFMRPDIAVRCAVNQIEPTPERVISNYFQGLYLLGKNVNEGFLWRSTPERAVITADTAHLPKRLQQYMKKDKFEIRSNENFDDVIRGCQRRDVHTWINEPIIDIYHSLYSAGYVTTLEAYREGELAGGIWGLEIGSTFSIMSMFHRVSHAGSILFGTLLNRLENGELTMIDCGLMNNNFKRYGAYAVPPDVFIKQVVNGCRMNPMKVTDSKNGRHLSMRSNGGDFKTSGIGNQ